MPAPSRKQDAWTGDTLKRLAEQHFPERGRELESLVRGMARRHETAWRTSSEGVFRPTPAMYALALSWELEKLGPTCTFCQGKIEIPERGGPGHPSGPTLALGPRVAARAGGLNVPQNLALCHADCLPTA